MSTEPKVVLITGCSYGLGRALTQGMIDRGHVVLGCSRSADQVDALRAEFPAPHRFDIVDVADDALVAKWARDVLAQHHAPDLLLNNAGIGQRQALPLWKQPADDFRRILATNVEGQANVIRHFVPPMLGRKLGVIVNFSSGWGREVAAKQSLYCASKWAVEGMTRALAQEILPTMAAVSLHPGIINTPGLQGAFKQDAGQYPTPDEWKEIAVPYILQIGPADNGKPLEVPGMPGYKIPQRLAGATADRPSSSPIR